MTWRGSTTPSERFFACLPYILPLLSGIGFVLKQFPALIFVVIQLQPILRFLAIPYMDLIIFLALFILVVRNETIKHFIRFNVMQAILLGIVVSICNLVVNLLSSPPLRNGLLVETLSTAVLLGLVGAVGYSIVQSIMGRYAEIPTLSDAVYSQVP